VVPFTNVHAYLLICLTHFVLVCSINDTMKCSGQPYNQLAILEAAKGNKLSTVFYYVRSVAVKHPFPVAATNLEKLYTKISTDK